MHTVSTTNVNEIPVNFKAAENGEYTISVNTDNVEMEYLHLIDNMTGMDIDLLSPAGVPLCKGGQGGFTEPRQATYTFTAKTTDYASRFRLVFVADGDVCEPNFAFVSNGEIIITGVGGDGDAGTASLQVVDVLGHVCRDAMIASPMIASPNHRISTTGMAPGVYVLRLVNGDDVKTQKIVID